MAMANISHFELEIQYDYNNYTYLFVKIFYHDNTTSLALYLAKQIDNQWKLVSGEDRSDLGYNLLAYLSTHAVHTLISSNDIDGDGIPNSSDPCPCKPGNCE